jgi:ribosome maturation factor RimP
LTSTVSVMLRDLKTEIEQLTEPIVIQEGFDLIEIKLSRFRRNYRLQIFVDSDHGVTLGDCASLSQLIGAALDIGDVMDARYILEISSSGLDRPLHSKRDFQRKIGKDMIIDLVDAGGPRSVAGKLTGITGDTLVIAGDAGEEKISLTEVQQGKIII